jgi:hypothetical protein
MGMQFMSTLIQPFWFRGHKLFGTCMLQSTLNPTMGVIYVGYFDNEINRTFLQLRLDMISDVLKTFFISGHTSSATTNKQHPTTSEAVIDLSSFTVGIVLFEITDTYSFVHFYQLINSFYFCLTNQNFEADVRYLWAV